MPALKPGRFGLAGLPAAIADVRLSFADGFVLPRWLRRPARLFSRLFDEEFQPPRFAASIGTAAFLSITCVYGAWVGGHVPVVAQAVTSRLGFAVEHVEMKGNIETSEIDVLGAIGLDGWTSLIGFDAEDARREVAALPWIRSASVRKIYPDTIEVELVEKKPFALWQHGNEISVIERSGEVIAPFTSGRHAALPLVIGTGARERANDFIGRVALYPELAARVKAYIRVGERRWNLRLENGITVRLPEDAPDAAIRDLAELDKSGGILSRDVVAIDMRIADRLTLQLSAQAIEQREIDLKEQARSVSARKAKRT